MQTAVLKSPHSIPRKILSLVQPACCSISWVNKFEANWRKAVTCSEASTIHKQIQTEHVTRIPPIHGVDPSNHSIIVVTFTHILIYKKTKSPQRTWFIFSCCIVPIRCAVVERELRGKSTTCIMSDSREPAESPDVAVALPLYDMICVNTLIIKYDTSITWYKLTLWNNIEITSTAWTSRFRAGDVMCCDAIWYDVMCACWRFESWLGLCRIELSCPFCVAGVAWSIFTRF